MADGRARDLQLQRPAMAVDAQSAGPSTHETLDTKGRSPIELRARPSARLARRLARSLYSPAGPFIGQWVIHFITDLAAIGSNDVAAPHDPRAGLAF